VSQPRFILYGSEGCHLCGIAEQLLGGVPQLVEAGCELIDIAFDDKLVARFGSRIPVLFDQQQQIYIDWPFQQAEIVKLFI